MQKFSEGCYKSSAYVCFKIKEVLSIIKVRSGPTVRPNLFRILDHYEKKLVTMYKINPLVINVSLYLRDGYSVLRRFMLNRKITNLLYFENELNYQRKNAV